MGGKLGGADSPFGLLEGSKGKHDERSCGQAFCATLKEHRRRLGALSCELKVCCKRERARI